MGNSLTYDSVGLRQVVLKMTSYKDPSLIDVLHVLDIRKNVVPDSLLIEIDFKVVFGFDKFIITKEWTVYRKWVLGQRTVQNECNDCTP